MQHRIGIYIRVSTDEQAQIAEGSLETQKHRLKSFVEIKNIQEHNWGKIIETYMDDGVSAKNTNRPAYQRLLKDIRIGKINLILITDLSRLSRNIADFCQLLQELEKYKAKFLSIKEQFDTSTPAGEMMLYNMINLAQFERKQTSERVAMNFHSRALRGLFNGGYPLLGYDKDPTNPGKIIVNQEEAKVVAHVFDIYLEIGSIAKTAKHLNQMDLKRKDVLRKNACHSKSGIWTMSSVQRLLNNYAYAGMREVNKGFKDEDQNTLKPWQKYQIVKGVWTPIVSEEVFYKVQNLLKKAKENERNRLENTSSRVFVVTKILRCGYCGRNLYGESAHGRNKVHRYYSHRKLHSEVINCPLKRIPADDIELSIEKHLRSVALTAGYFKKIEANLEKSFGNRSHLILTQKKNLTGQIEKAKSEIDTVFKMASDFSTDKNCTSLIQERLINLAQKKKELEDKLEMVSGQEVFTHNPKEAILVIEETVTSFVRGYKKAMASLKKRLIQRVFDQIIVTNENLKLYFKVEKENHLLANNHGQNRTLGKPLSVSFLDLFWLPSADTNFGSLVNSSGARGTKVEEPLVIGIEYPIQWSESRVNLSELAKLRWIEGWSTEKLAKHYSRTHIAIKNYYSLIRRSHFHFLDLTNDERKKIKWALKN